MPSAGSASRPQHGRAASASASACQPLDEIRSARAKTAQRRSAAMTRSNSSQSSWVPPAATKTERMIAGTSRPCSAPSSGPIKRTGPATATHSKPLLKTSVARPDAAQQLKLAGAPAYDRGDATRPVDGVVDDAGAHHRRMHRAVGAGDGQDGEVVVGGGQPLDICEVSHGWSFPIGATTTTTPSWGCSVRPSEAARRDRCAPRVPRAHGADRRTRRCRRRRPTSPAHPDR